MNRKSIACLAAVALALLAGDLGAQNPNYILSIGAGSVAPGGVISTTVNSDSTAGGDIQGWSYGVCHDGSALTLLAYADGATTATINQGVAPGFNSINTNPAGGTGYTVGVVINLFGAAVLPPTANAELSLVTYTNNMANGLTSDICFCNTLGAPPVDTLVVVGGASIVPTQECGTVTSFVPPTVDHIRGDANDDSLVNIADGVWILNDLFQGGPSTDCFGANDANADGSFDASDGVYVFNYQFLDGPAPAAPFPSCGGDSDPDPSDCASYSSCP